MADLTRDDILKIARLARLDLDESEVSMYQTELSEILGYIDQLAAVDVTGLEPAQQVTGLVNVTRADEVIDYGYVEATLLKGVPHVEADQIKVKRMIG